MIDAATSSFITLAPGERRIREYHIVEETGQATMFDVIIVTIGLLLFIVPGVLAIISLVLRARVSEIVTVTNQRVIQYRHERGRLTNGHSYASVRLCDVSGVQTDRDRALRGETILISIHTARAEGIAVGAGSHNSRLGRLFSRNNIGPDAERARQELPSLLPALRAGETVG